MDEKELASFVERPETHRKIVGDYTGAYALGTKGNAFHLRVASSDVSAFPTHVTVDGVEVPVIVEGDFKEPVPLRVRL